MLNIYQRLNEVRKLVEYVKKEKKVENYTAVTHDQITALTRNHFVSQGVIVVPVEQSGQTVLTGGTSKSGTAALRFESQYRVDFVNIDEPKDIASVVVSAHANDYGDKAPGKAVSYAVKTAILKILSLETGEDDESRFTEREEGVPEADIVSWIEKVKGAGSQKDAKEAYTKAVVVCNAANDPEARARIKEALMTWA